MKPEHDEALVEQVARALLRNMLDPDYDEAKMLALVAIPLIRTTDAARIAELVADLEWYADQFCEHGKYSEVCGRLGPDDCSGCLARATLRSNPDAG